MSENNRRKAVRKLQNYPAKLYWTSSGGTVDCVLKDISASGARIRLPADLPYFAIHWPRQLTLQIMIDQVEVDCILIRRERSEMAFKFLSSFRSLRPNDAKHIASQDRGCIRRSKTFLVTARTSSSEFTRYFASAEPAV